MSKNITNILKGIGISVIFTMIFLLIFSAILTYTDVSEEAIQPVVIVITAISILIGSSIGNWKIKKNGILNGSIIGGMYFILLYLLSSIVKMDFAPTKGMIIIIIVGMIFGILGGIVGVNKGSA